MELWVPKNPLWSILTQFHMNLLPITTTYFGLCWLSDSHLCWTSFQSNRSQSSRVLWGCWTRLRNIIWYSNVLLKDSRFIKHPNTLSSCCEAVKCDHIWWEWWPNQLEWAPRCLEEISHFSFNVSAEMVRRDFCANLLSDRTYRPVSVVFHASNNR